MTSRHVRQPGCLTFCGDALFGYTLAATSLVTSVVLLGLAVHLGLTARAVDESIIVAVFSLLLLGAASFGFSFTSSVRRAAAVQPVCCTAVRQCSSRHHAPTSVQAS